MLSRVADSIYWMSRYIERAENVARFVDVNHHLMLDLPADVPQQWEPLVVTAGGAEEFAARYGEPSQENVIQFLTFDSENPNSILSSLRAARENARSVREIIPAIMWEELNEFCLYVEAEAAKKENRDFSYDFFRHVKRAGHLLEGVTNATLSHGEAWHFSRTGRLLERADKTTRIVDVKYFMLLPSAAEVGSPTDDLHWTAVLQSASAFAMYRRRHGMVQFGQTAAFLILDPEFPRSVRNCVRRANESLHAITGTPLGTFQNPAERHLGQLVAELDYTDMEEVILRGLHEFLDGLQIKLDQVGDAIFDSFFASKPVG